MILFREASSLRLVTQPDHAHFAGRLLALWRADSLPQHPRREELLFAVREHDNGWREADAAPSLDRGSGRPHSFLDLPAERRIEIWERGTARFASRRPYAALLITRHGRELHRDRQGDPDWEAFLGLLAERYGELLEATGAGDPAVAADYRWLDLADRLSLAVCNGWERPLTCGRTQARVRGSQLLLEPFPLAGPTTFRIPCRHIPDRRYAGDADLGGELASARWREFAIQVAGG